MKSKLNEKQKMVSVYNYDDITIEEKSIVLELLDLLKERKKAGVDLSIIIEEFKQKFKIEEIPQKPIENTLWDYYTKDVLIGQNIQGFKTITENNKKINIPVLCFSADIDTLNKLITKILVSKT
jgi:hypothetical protein